MVKVDLVIRKETPYRRAEFERRMAVSLPGFKAWLVSKEDLILSKLVWAKAADSELQRRDVQNLLSASPDVAYLRHWAPALDVADLLERMLLERHQP